MKICFLISFKKWILKYHANKNPRHKCCEYVIQIITAKLYFYNNRVWFVLKSNIILVIIMQINLFQYTCTIQVTKTPISSASVMLSTTIYFCWTPWSLCCWGRMLPSTSMVNSLCKFKWKNTRYTYFWTCNCFTVVWKQVKNYLLQVPTVSFFNY